MAYSKHFRENDLKKVFEAILDGDSIAMIGIGTVGKTLLVSQFSERVDVQENLLSLCNSGFKPEHLLFVRYDTNALLDLRGASDGVPRSWIGFELLLHRLIRAIRDLQLRLVSRPGVLYPPALDELAAKLDQFYQAIQSRDGFGLQMTYRLLEEAILHTFTFFNQTYRAGRLILVFDEFERLLKLMPVSFFLNLRALRDQFRYQLIFVTATRQPIGELVQDLKPGKRAEMEPFTELFRHTHYIGPNLTTNDREEMLDALVKRTKYQGWQWPSGLKERLLYITGGHNGLTRTCFSSDILEAMQRAPSHQAAIHRLLYEETVNRECLNILESFTNEEQDVLTRIATGEVLPDIVPVQITLRSLERKFAVERTPSGYQVSPPLLWYYLGKSARGDSPTSSNQPFSFPQ